MKFSTASAWLDWIGSVHKTDIDLGLDRISQVAERLGVLHPSCSVITVGGTNGKGSVVAGLESIYLAAGFHVGCFTSPYFFQHNEEVRIDGVTADDESFCRAFEKIESARADVSLTPFEYHTLAAILIFQEKPLDVMILEVGLGGRLDAVNIFDADAAVVTSIGIDHTAWLGETREEIGFEKAGIFRNRTPAICGDAHPPESLVNVAKQTGAKLFIQDKAFHFEEASDSWSWFTSGVEFKHLPKNQLLTQNMSTVLMTVHLMQTQLRVSEDVIRKGLKEAKLPGRIQIIAGDVQEVLDVAHNPAAVEQLSKQLQAMPIAGKTYVVFSMLEDKDMKGAIEALAPLTHQWFSAPLTCKRAASPENLEKAFSDAKVDAVEMDANLADSYKKAKQISQPGDRIVVFGSFHTVADIIRVAGHSL